MEVKCPECKTIMQIPENIPLTDDVICSCGWKASIIELSYDCLAIKPTGKTMPALFYLASILTFVIGFIASIAVAAQYHLMLGIIALFGNIVYGCLLFSVASLMERFSYLSQRLEYIEGKVLAAS